jgi:hypothetical protein
MGTAQSEPVTNNTDGKVATSIFDFNVQNIDGAEISLSKFKGKKAYLVVNVASQ